LSSHVNSFGLLSYTQIGKLNSVDEKYKESILEKKTIIQGVKKVKSERDRISAVRAKRIKRGKMTERTRITLILGDIRFHVDKKRIIERSRYFESLFNHNFSDSKDNEQTVNYEVAPSVLQVM
jgi:hypothetical protein